MEIDQLLQPLSMRDFVAQYWGRSELHLPGAAPDEFKRVRHALDLESTIWREQGRWGDLSLARTGVSAASCPHLHSPAAMDVLQAALGDGYTVVINNYQQKCPAVAALCRSFEQAFLARCNVNFYMTGPGCQGLDAHYDDTDVFVLQIEGRKTWRIRSGGRLLPLDGEDYRPLDGTEATRATLELEVGDVLYIPRGVVHQANTTGALSMHLTVSVSSPRWLTFFHQALRTLARSDVLLREDVRLWAAPASGDDPAEIAARLARHVGECLADRALIGATLRGMQSQCIATLDPLPGDKALCEPAAPPLSEASILSRARSQLCMLDDGTNPVVLRFVGGQMEFDEDLRASVRFICEHATFSVGEIPGELSRSQRVGLATRLVEVGLLEHAVASAE